MNEEHRKRIEDFLHRSESLIDRAERGCEDAQNWVAFWNLTIITVVVLAVVLLLRWWLG